ncbi:SAM-dependent methyltransferase, MidA family [Mucilaginibacter pineti]|uniref:SAM-dependent methyltransferase, MidA family n=1 Tax=Mucilaginibacter pineti TaxID=1391627 RepID=A0A1G7HA66_9SPHI|nr:SAM-dependent methyltransferase [Mucilaginibacter pineti]SDE97318.1 SAM-dependent methyltransferase, MidA family [Mucilaginibacter pineti]
MELSELICRQIRENGPVSFHDFMEMALYHPEYGYYMASREKIGPKGDFYTSCSLGSVFGAMIAKQLVEMWHLSGEENFTVVEFGAGDGTLCHDILDYFRNYTNFYERLQYVIIEKSPFMRKKEKAHLPEKVCWYDTLEMLGAFTGCVLSNELVDNFAVHQVVMYNELMEVFLEERNGLVEVLRPASAALKAYFENLNVELPVGYRAEVNVEAAAWLENISRYLQKGFVLTIDYGYTSNELYSSRRSRGTLLCYQGHQVNESFYENIGKQDITSHVNFSGLCHWGHQYGLFCCGLTSQAEFLLALDFKGYLRQQLSDEKDILRLAIQESHLTRTLLIDMGRKFKVLIQRKDIPAVQLTGLKDFRTA